MTIKDEHALFSVKDCCHIGSLLRQQEADADGRQLTQNTIQTGKEQTLLIQEVATMEYSKVISQCKRLLNSSRSDEKKLSRKTTKKETQQTNFLLRLGGRTANRTPTNAMQAQHATITIIRPNMIVLTQNK